MATLYTITSPNVQTSIHTCPASIPNLFHQAAQRTKRQATAPFAPESKKQAQYDAIKVKVKHKTHPWDGSTINFPTHGVSLSKYTIFNENANLQASWRSWERNICNS